ncbi:M48 family metallopeptidase [Novosphingobium humi]|uniref:SprT family zinc-dependent metalloprotease n=1 Tax=Novosphingobium humi TaxID=2282397 RepID=A0ABY7TWC9_9SPHN|nr:SprT family zinc-dependent metalloprotease [Novosphingobium humi]WCT77567.1 SprT family zinc-dependent metalloprotease [Novosphingobium humi]WJS98909.1 M48 family metallopeptidase [Novosphingobium humi]
MLDWLLPGQRKGGQKEESPSITLNGRRVPITIRRLPQSRRMTMRLAPDGSEVRIAMPKWGRTQDALDFAHLRADWLAAQLARHTPKVDLAPGGTILFAGVPHRIAHSPGSARRVVCEGGVIHMGGALDSLVPRLTRWMQAQAREHFIQDLAFYCDRAGVPMPPLALSGAQARWGSCSARGAVRLNWRLMMAPDSVRRAVVAHEVTHLVHFNHSPAFHALLAQLFEGSIEETNRWLKRHGRSLYTPLG